MSDLKCDRCGWSARGHIIEANLSPRFFGVASTDTLVAWAELDHFLRTGCKGSLVEDTSHRDAQWNWMMGRRGIPFDRLPKWEQIEIEAGVPIDVDHVLRR